MFFGIACFAYIFYVSAKNFSESAKASTRAKTQIEPQIFAESANIFFYF
jgi:hypothetical protein